MGTGQVSAGTAPSALQEFLAAFTACPAGTHGSLGVGVSRRSLVPQQRFLRACMTVWDGVSPGIPCCLNGRCLEHTWQLRMGWAAAFPVASSAVAASMHGRLEWDGRDRSAAALRQAQRPAGRMGLPHSSADSCWSCPPRAALPVLAQSVPPCRHWAVADVQGGWQRGGWRQRQPPRVPCSSNHSSEGGGSASRGARSAVSQPAGPAPQGAPLAGGSQVSACDVCRAAAVHRGWGQW